MADKKNEIDEQRKKQMQEFKQNKVKEQEIFLPINLSGPTHQRQATDSAYAQIMIFIVIGFLAIGGYAYYKSSIKTIIPLLDYQDNTCGLNKKELFPQLYFQKSEKGWTPICLNQCPEKVMKEWDSYYEQYDDIKITKSYKTKNVKDYYYLIIIAATASLIIMIGLVSYLNSFGGKLIWGIFLTIIFCVLQLTALFFSRYIKKDSTSLDLDNLIIFGVLTIVLSLAIIIYRKSIQETIALYKAASQFLMLSKGQFFIKPIFMFILTFGIIGGFFFTLLLLISQLAQYSYSKDRSNNFPLHNYNYFDPIQCVVLAGVQLLLTLYLVSYVQNMFKFLYYAAACHYYYKWEEVHKCAEQQLKAAQSKENNFEEEEGVSANSCFVQAQEIFSQNHTGSVAQGSLLLPFFGYPLFITLGYLYSLVIYYREYFKNTNLILYYLLFVLTLPFYFYEKIFRFYNDFAYIMIVIDSKNFFESSKNSALLINENFQKFSPLSFISGFVKYSFIIITFVFSFCTTFVITLYAKFLTQEEMQDMHYLFLFVAVLFVIFLSTQFFLPIHYVEEALLICYLIDCEIQLRYFGKFEPQYCPTAIKETIQTNVLF